MRVPLSWLGEYVDLELAPEQLAERLTLLGMEVEGIDRIGTDWRSVVVGELLDVVPHPASPRLSLTRVDVGDGRPALTIVCGATNIRPGQRVPVARPGAVLPGGRRIETTRIAGEESQGMLCSGVELRLTDDADGILILPQASPVGRPLAELYGDVVLDVDVKPNRGDALSLVGIAREVAAATGARLRPPIVEVPEAGDATADHVWVEVRDAHRCPRFVARYVDGIAVGPSPLAIQLRLAAAGLRPISNVVDASNYVMLELGKPVHAFDAAAVPDGRLIVRLSQAGEHLETLDHVVRELDSETLLIAGTDGPLGIAGIMGGAASEVGEATNSVIVESATFDPVAIRRTAQRYGLRSDASQRFEKGQEWRLARVGADRTAQLIARWAGGRAAVGAVDTDPAQPPATRVAFRPARVNRLLGMALRREEMRTLLGRVEVGTEPATSEDGVPVVDGEAPVGLLPSEVGDALVAIVPPHRRDLTIEADVAEEIARIRGYDTIAPLLPATRMPPYRPEPRRLVDELRELLAARGLNEVITAALRSPAEHTGLGWGAGDPATIQIANPVSVDHSELRRSLLPGLVEVLRSNERQRRHEVAIYEVGAVHRWEAGEPREEPTVALLLAGAADPPGLNVVERSWELADAKGLVEWLVLRFSRARVWYEPTAPLEGVEHPGRTAAVLGETDDGHRVTLGRVTELHPRYLAAAELRASRVAFASLSIDGLGLLRPARVRVGGLPRVPSVERDVALVVDEARHAAELEAVIRASGGPLLDDVRLFDRYVGAPLASGQVSLAYRLRFQATDHGPSEAELDGAVGQIVAAARERLGARLRS